MLFEVGSFSLGYQGRVHSIQILSYPAGGLDFGRLLDIFFLQANNLVLFPILFLFDAPVEKFSSWPFNLVDTSGFVPQQT